MIASYPEFMTMRGPQGFTAAINEAAARESLSLSEFARRAIIERAGVTPPVLKPAKKEG